jgi:hypothetical protein
MIVDKSLEEYGRILAHLFAFLVLPVKTSLPLIHTRKRETASSISGVVAIKVDDILGVLFGVWSRRLRPCLAVQPNMHGDSSSCFERLAAILARDSAGS